MKINRYSCKCKLCKAKWTTESTDRITTYRAHLAACPKLRAALETRMNRFKSSADNELYQLSALYLEHIQIQGYFSPDVKCDARCEGATGHVCSCSCGGKNHGAGAIAA